MRKKTILFCLRTDKIYGAENKMMKIVNMLSQEIPGYRYVLAVAANGAFVGRLNDNVELILLPSVSPQDNFFKKVFAYSYFLLKIRPKAVFFSQFKLSSFGIAELLSANLLMIKRIVQILHSSPKPIERYKSKKWFGIFPGMGLSWRLEKLNRFLLQFFSTCVITVSSRISRDLSSYEGWNYVRVRELPYGIDVNRFKPDPLVRKAVRKRLSIPENAIVLISTSRIDANKRVDWIVEVFKYVKDRTNSEVFLILLGDGPEDYLRRILTMISNYKLSDFVRYIGYTEDVSLYLKASDIFLLLSQKEGFGIGLLEAMASGLLCISTPTEGPSEIIEHNVSGVLVDDDLSKIKERVLDIVENYNDKTYIKEGARSRILSQYDWQKVKSKIKEIFMEKC